jgi:hypothetical protein
MLPLGTGYTRHRWIGTRAHLPPPRISIRPIRIKQITVRQRAEASHLGGEQRVGGLVCRAAHAQHLQLRLDQIQVAQRRARRRLLLQ